MPNLAGVDLGATNLRVAVADGTGAMRAVERRRTPTGGAAAVLDAVVDALERAADGTGVDVAALDAVGVGTVGPLDRAAGTVVDPPNLPAVDALPLGPALVERVGHDRVVVENDAVAGLVGERAASPAPPANLVYLTLSTGIGAGVAVDGHILRGRRGNAAEVGHLVVDPRGRRTCGCGKPGHWEAYCAGAAIPGFTRDVAESTGLETELALDDSALSAADVLGAAGGDPLADAAVACVVRYNAIGVADLVHAFAPDRLVVGGAVALGNPDRLVAPLRAAAADHTMLAVPEIRRPVHGHDAVLQGALALAAEAAGVR